MNLKRKFIRLAIRYSKWYKSFKKEEVLNESQKRALDIFGSLLYDKHNSLLVCPLTGKRFIESAQIFTILEVCSLTIIDTSSKRFFNNQIPEETSKNLIFEFDKEVKRRRRKLEMMYKAVIKDGLDDINSKIGMI